MMKIKLDESNVSKLNEFFKFYGENPEEYNLEKTANTMLDEALDDWTGKSEYTWKRDREIMLSSFRKESDNVE